MARISPLPIFQNGIEGKITIHDVQKNNMTAFFIRAEMPDGQGIDPTDGFSVRLAYPDDKRKIFAQYRKGIYWCRAAFPADFDEIPEETQALLYEEPELGFSLILPVTDQDYKATLEGRTLRLRSFFAGLSRCDTLAYIYATGPSPRELVHDSVAFAMELTGRNYPLREKRRFPDLFEYLGWCSWDAFKIRVNEKGVLDKCAEFKNKEIPVRWIILDDMWGDVKGLYDTEHPDFETVLNNRQKCSLNSFDADPFRFPDGLKAFIRALKDQYGLETGIWHTINGFWSGIDLEGPIAEALADSLMVAPGYEVSDSTSDFIRNSKKGQLVPDWHEEAAFRFFDAYHSYLKNCGASFVKVDYQSTLRLYYAGLAPIGRIGSAFHKALDRSAEKHFQNRMINCMCMASESLWNRPSSPLARCSTDFQPNNQEWFGRHLTLCTWNSLIQGEFLWSDYDMWWSGDPQARKNSVVRALSGGPVYVSDKVGESDRDVLLPLVLSDGRILRCDSPGIPADDCVLENPASSGKPFKLFNTAGSVICVGAFNLSETGEAVAGQIVLKNLSHLANKDCYAYYERFTDSFGCVTAEEAVPILLKNSDDFRLFLFAPLSNDFTSFGLTEKLITPRTVETHDEPAPGLHVIRLKEGGHYLFFSQKPVRQLFLNGHECSFEQPASGFYIVDCTGEAHPLLRILL